MEPVVQWILGIWIGITVVIFGHIYKQIIELRTEMQETGSAQMKELWVSLSQLRTEIAENRVKIASDMVTKDDLDRQVTRLVGEMDRRMMAAIRTRPPIRDH